MPSVSANRNVELGTAAIRIFAEFLPAYLALSPKLQEAVQRMVAIVADSEADEDDRDMALFTIEEILFPEVSAHDGLPGIDLDDLERFATGEARAAIEEMNREEATFAERLRAAMTAKGMTQAQLASAIGVGQPAISNFLNRQSRPQSRTVEKIAEALGMETEELWPA